MTTPAPETGARRLSAAEEAFRSAWESVRGKDGPMSTLRRAGYVAFDAVGLPSSRVEAWKYTSLRSLSRKAFRAGGPLSTPTPDELDSMALGTLDGPRLVFLNGRLQGALSATDTFEGLQIVSLADAMSGGFPAAEEILGRLANVERHPFAALNQAFLGDGVFISVALGTQLEKPLCLMFVSSPGGDSVAMHPRIVVDAGRGSRLVMVEHYTGTGDAVNLTNAVTEIRAGQDAQVEHYRLQEETGKSFHLGSLHARLLRNAKVHSHNIQLGAALARLDIGVTLEEPGAEVIMNGLYLVDGKRHVDNHTRVDHLAPETRSDELYRGIVDDRGRAVFNGKAVVHQDAQRIDAHQSNKNLLLSRQAEVDTKPELEIYADDVKCSHGATVGQLDKNALFYLLSRGIGRDVARKLLTYAFAEVVAARMPLEAVRRRLEQRLAGALPDAHMIRQSAGETR